MADCISREAAIDTAFDYRVDVIENDYDRGYQTAVKDIAKALNAIPAADVRPVKRGKWTNGKYRDIYACSVCGDIVVVRKNFCPNCGADMRGEGTDFSAPLKMTTGEGKP